MKNVFDMIAQFVEQKFQLESKKRLLRAKAVKTGETVFLQHVMPVVTNIVRQLIVEKGLNPDYVPPPPPPPTVEAKPRPTWTAPHSYGWEREVIKGRLAKHPVIASRLKLKAEGGLRDRVWEQEQAEAERAVATAASSEPPLQVCEPITVADTNALDNLRKFMDEFDALVMEMPKKENKPSTKRHGRKKPSKKRVAPAPAKVTKNFGGYFRRVSEE